MVLVVFMRHGRAEPPSGGVVDSERRLTHEGSRDVEAVSRLLARLGVSRVLTSPYRRAVETGEIVSRIVGVKLEIVEWLAPDSGVSIGDLPGLGVGGGAILIGHNPWLENTIVELVGGAIVLQPGGFAAVDVGAFRPGGGVLRLLVSPEVVA